MVKRINLCVLLTTALWFGRCADALGQETGQTDLQAGTVPFFAFDNGVGRDDGWSPERQASVLAELGYQGIGYSGTKNIPAVLKALEARRLKLFSIYVGATVEPGKPPYDPSLREAIQQLSGRDTVIWLTIVGAPPSSTSRDEQAVQILREIGEIAAKAGLRVAMYPHAGNYVATVQDAVRLARKVYRPNVGVSFNLCHFLKLDEEKNLPRRLEEAMPYLYLVSINGADRGETRQMDWNRLIQTLDRGSFNVYGLLTMLKRLGYHGPIGLQCYAIPGEPRENLNRSMRAWKDFQIRMATEPQ